MYWKAKGIVAAIFSLGIMIPVQATLLPLFQGLDRLGIRGGYLGLMLPYITFAMPMTVMILSGFFQISAKRDRMKLHVSTDVIFSICFSGSSCL